MVFVSCVFVCYIQVMYKFKLLFTFLISIGGLVCVHCACFQFAYFFLLLLFYLLFFRRLGFFRGFIPCRWQQDHLFFFCFVLYLSLVEHHYRRNPFFLNINIFSIVPDEKKQCLRMLLFPREQHTVDVEENVWWHCVLYTNIPYKFC